jgi:hypothetical protein
VITLAHGSPCLNKGAKISLPGTKKEQRRAGQVFVRNEKDRALSVQIL